MFCFPRGTIFQVSCTVLLNSSVSYIVFISTRFPFSVNFFYPLSNAETFNLGVHSLSMGEELKSMHRKGTTCGLR